MAVHSPFQFRGTRKQLYFLTNKGCKIRLGAAFLEDTIISKFLERIIAIWNKSAGCVLGYTADEAVGQPITILILGDRPNKEPVILVRIRSGKRVEHFDTIHRRN